MSKIDKLTPEQEAKIPEYVEKWSQIGLDNTLMDKERAEKAVRELYRSSGNPEPKEVLFFDSPEAIRKVLKEKYGITDQTTIYFGSLDAYWLSTHDYAEEVLGMDYEHLTEHFHAYKEFAKSCGGAFTFDERAFVFEKPTLKFDENGREHAENDLAIKFPDGTGLACWHGQRIPNEWMINPDSLTAEKALTWSQADQRQAACEIVGWDKILEQLNAKVIDRYINPQTGEYDPSIGELVEVELPPVDNEPMGKDRFLRCMCGTGRIFAMPVPPDMQRAKQANAWLANENEDEYNPEVRT